MTFHIYVILSILIITQQFCVSFCDIRENMTEPIVQVSQGKLKGRIAEDHLGENYYSFQGIPYAKPPIDELRFKAPVAAEPWTGIYDATKEGNECVQFDPIQKTVGGSEDCLFLNVYTRELPNNGTLKPVMVWIHGGAFTSGSSKTNLYGPDFLIIEDVVIVSINYRVAILGFLSLEDTSLGVPGNAGLKDMVLALKWVQNNIKEFNGNPNNVTIFGESAGSAACHYLMMSETAKGLFHRAILQSGVCINQWAIGSRNAIKIAQVLGSNATNETEALEFLKREPAESFIKAQHLIVDDLAIDHIRPFGPVIEKPNPEAFITENPLDLMLSGKYNKVPLIIGYTNREGMLFEIIAKLNGKSLTYRLEDFERAVPSYYNIKRGTNQSKIIANKIKDFYYGNSSTPEEDTDSYYIMNSDTFFIRGIHLTIRELLKTLDQPIYFYRFNIETSMNLFKTLGNITRPGVSHADDLGYMFKGLFTPEFIPGSEECIAIRRVIKLWANFARTGNPNPETYNPLFEIKWPQVTSDNFQCLNIDKKYTVSKNPEEERMQFWNEISAMNGINSKL